MTRQTGVTHRAFGEEAERQLLVVFCNSEPPPSVRKAISDLTGWTWVASTAGRPSYRLVKGIQLQRQEAALRQRFYQQYGNLVRNMIDAAQDPNWKPKAGSPLDHQVQEIVSGSVLRSVGRLPQDALASVLGGNAYAASGRTLPQAFKQSCNELLKAHVDSLSASDNLSLRDTDTVKVELARAGSGKPSSLQWTLIRDGKLRVQFNTAHVALANVGVRESLRDPAALRDLVRENPALGEPLPNRPPLEWPKPPDPRPSYVGWQLRDLARRTSYPLIADCYPAAEMENGLISSTPVPWPAPANNGRRLYLALNDLEPIDYRWRLQDKWILARHTAWFWEPLRQSATGKEPRAAVIHRKEE